MVEKRAFIFVNGQHVDHDTIRAVVEDGDTRVAVDGGLRILRELDWLPDLLIGDLDSVLPEDLDIIRASGVQIRQFPIHKDETDLELALDAVLESGVGDIRIVGALGGRLDMTLGNIFLLMRPDLLDCDVRLDDGYDEVFLIHSGKRGSVTGVEGERISLVPVHGPVHGICTEGLFYPLNHETLWPDRTRGISNVMTGHTACITVNSGMLLCIHSRLKSLLEEKSHRGD